MVGGETLCHNALYDLVDLAQLVLERREVLAEEDHKPHRARGRDRRIARSSLEHTDLAKEVPGTEACYFLAAFGNGSRTRFDNEELVRRTSFFGESFARSHIHLVGVSRDEIPVTLREAGEQRYRFEAFGVDLFTPGTYGQQ